MPAYRKSLDPQQKIFRNVLSRQSELKLEFIIPKKRENEVNGAHNQSYEKRKYFEQLKI